MVWVAVTVVTMAVFSARLMAAVALPPLLVICGALSLAGLTLTDRAWVSPPPLPSDTWTITS